MTKPVVRRLEERSLVSFIEDPLDETNLDEKTNWLLTYFIVGIIGFSLSSLVA
jgi:hypothetical protein